MSRIRTLFTAAWLACMLLFCGLCSAAPCAVAVQSIASVDGASFTLADLLSPQSCPEFAIAASRLALGRVPLEGSPRIIDGSELRARIKEFSRQNHGDIAQILDVPKKITVSRAGARLSCTEIAARLLNPAPQEPGSLSPEIDCGAGGRIRRDAALEITNKKSDPALHTWILSVRCTDPADCVPFVLRSPDATSGNIARNMTLIDKPATPVVRAGQSASLLWERNGIRLVLPVVCMEPGAVGDLVQVRTANRLRVLRAIVVGVGILRAIS